MKFKSAIVFYQDDVVITIKDGDYIEVELIDGTITEGIVSSIDTWECDIIHLVDISYIDISEIKRIISVEE